VELDAVVGEGRLDPRVIRRMDEEGCPDEALLHDPRRR
jgi:GABA permease